MPYCFRSGRDVFGGVLLGLAADFNALEAEPLDALQRDFERFGAHPVVCRKMHDFPRAVNAVQTRDTVSQIAGVEPRPHAHDGASAVSAVV